MSAKNVKQSKQYNYEKGQSVTQKETVKWSVNLETAERCYWDLV